MLTIGAMVLRVQDLDRMVAFWSAALDLVPRESDDDGWVSLQSRTGDSPNLSFDRKPSEYDLPPRSHLDLHADDREAEVARLVALGATVVPLEHRSPVDWTLLEDPEGTPHPLGRHTASRRAGTGGCGPSFDVADRPADQRSAGSPVSSRGGG